MHLISAQKRKSRFSHAVVIGLDGEKIPVPVDTLTVDELESILDAHSLRAFISRGGEPATPGVWLPPAAWYWNDPDHNSFAEISGTPVGRYKNVTDQALREARARQSPPAPPRPVSLLARIMGQ